MTFNGTAVLCATSNYLLRLLTLGNGQLNPLRRLHTVLYFFSKSPEEFGFES
jgi:hypothetical protein